MSRFVFGYRCWAALAPAALLFFSNVPAIAQDDAALQALAAKAKTELPAIQKKLAAGSDLLKAVRLVNVEVAGKTLKPTGVFLSPPYVPSDEKKDTPTDLMWNELTTVLRTELAAPNLNPDRRGIKEIFPVDHPHIFLMAAANLAGAAGNRAADEVQLTGSRFDEKGNLVVEGIRGGSEAAGLWLKTALRDYAAAKPAALGQPLPETNAQVTLAEWTLSVPALQKWLYDSNDPALRRLRVDRIFFAYDVKNNNPVNAFKTLVPQVEGVILGTQGIGAENKNKLIEHINKQKEKLLAGTKFSTKVVFPNVEGLTNAWVDEAKLVTRLRAAVSARPVLDGLRVDPGTSFGPGGEIRLTGLRPPLRQEGQPVAFARAVTECMRAELALGGADDESLRVKRLGTGSAVSVDAMEEADTPALLAKLRAWVADNKDDVRLSRLLFGPDGGLKLVCETPEGTVQDILENLIRWKPEFIKEKSKPRPGSDTPPEKVPGKGLTENAADTSPIATTQPAKEADQFPAPSVVPPAGESFPTFKSLTALLRDEVTKDPDPKAPARWEGVYIERGFFDKNNRYTLRGVVDRDDQNGDLASVLESLKGSPQWKSYFAPEQPARPALQVISMTDLLARVQRVAPAYEDLDGFQITGAKYRVEKDPKTDKKAQVLVFSAHMVNPAGASAGSRLNRTAAQRLTDLIRADADHFGKRLPKDGREVELTPDPLQDDVDAQIQIGHFSNGIGALYLARAGEAPFFERCALLTKARRWIDAGLLHAPDQTSIWFLSAYYNFVLGDRELARRDLYRIIAIEEPLSFNGGDQRRRRYETAKDLQGPTRTELERFWLRCWKEVKDGAKPMTMAAWFALTDSNFATLRSIHVPEPVLAKLMPLKNKALPRSELKAEIARRLTPAEVEEYESPIANHAKMVPGK